MSSAVLWKRIVDRASQTDLEIPTVPQDTVYIYAMIAYALSHQE